MTQVGAGSGWGARHDRLDGPPAKLDRTAARRRSRGRGPHRRRGDRRGRRCDRRTRRPVGESLHGAGRGEPLQGARRHRDRPGQRRSGQPRCHGPTRFGLVRGPDRPVRRRRRPARRPRRFRRRPAGHDLHAHQPVGRRPPDPGDSPRDGPADRRGSRRRCRQRVGRAATDDPSHRGAGLPVHPPGRGWHGRGFVGLPGARAAPCDLGPAGGHDDRSPGRDRDRGHLRPGRRRRHGALLHDLARGGRTVRAARPNPGVRAHGTSGGDALHGHRPARPAGERDRADPRAGRDLPIRDGGTGSATGRPIQVRPRRPGDQPDRGPDRRARGGDPL